MRFDSYHPAISFIFFVTVLACATAFDQPVFLALSFLCPFAYSLKLNGGRAMAFNLALLPLIALYAAFYASYHHFGLTVLATNAIGNQITLEALTYGLVLGVTAASVLIWFSCIFAVVSSDQIIYLFGRVASKLSLFLSILLRLVPRIKERARRIHAAQRCVGRGVGQGNPLQRLRNLLRVASITLTWLLESLVELSDAMRSRGYTLKGRTAYSIYRFDHRDRGLVIVLFTGITVLLMAYLLGQTHILYNPEIQLNRLTPLSYAFHLAYAVFCLLPLGLQLHSEWHFRRQRRGITALPYKSVADASAAPPEA